MATLFCHLPLDVLIIILEHTPNLAALYKFICASASINTVFETSPASILDNVIERSIPEFKHLARMVAILGSFSASSSSEKIFMLGNLIDKYNDLPKDVLTTAPAWLAFMAGTPGPRYLVLTAYRIEILQHVCFVYLLQNIHEVIWYTTPEDKRESHFYPIKQSTDGVSFQAAAWWSPSWAEKTRITRAYWKLMIFWNIQAIHPRIGEDYYRFSQYSAAIEDIDPCIGPSLANDEIYDVVCHEIEAMKCVLSATNNFMSYTYDLSYVFSPFQSEDFYESRMEKWTSSALFKETSHWKFEEPKPMTGANARHNGQESTCVDRMNSGFRQAYWALWFRCVDRDGHNPQFADSLGLCIWDYKRQGYLGLTYMDGRFLEPCLGPIRNPTHPFFTSTDISARWRDVFEWEMDESRELLRQIPEDLNYYIRRWESDLDDETDDIDRWRLEID